MPDAETCRKCGNEPRQGSHPWGKTCRAEYRRKGKAGNVTAVTPTGEGEDGNPVTPLLADIERLTAALQTEKAAHALDVQVFEEQLAGLKTIGAGKDATIVTLTARLAKLEVSATRAPREEGPAFEAEMTRTRAENLPPPKKALGGQYTPHGEQCICQACGTGKPAEVATTPCPYQCMKRHVHLRGPGNTILPVLETA